MKLSMSLQITLLSLSSNALAAAVPQSFQGPIELGEVGIEGDEGFLRTGIFSRNNCRYGIAYFDLNKSGGKAMHSQLLAAKLTKRPLTWMTFQRVSIGEDNLFKCELQMIQI